MPQQPDLHVVETIETNGDPVGPVPSPSTEAAAIQQEAAAADPSTLVIPTTQSLPAQHWLQPLAMEAALATGAGATIGAIAAPKTRRTKTAMTSSLFGFGAYALVRALFRPAIPEAGVVLARPHRAVLGLLGTGAVAGGAWWHYRKKAAA